MLSDEAQGFFNLTSPNGFQSRASLLAKQAGCPDRESDRRNQDLVHL